MIVRFDSVVSAPRAKRASFAEQHRAARTAVAAACFLFSGLAAAQGASAPPAGAAPATAASAAAPVNIVGQYAIHPGQSLHDAAVDLTQSHDKAVLARMASALFDANPQAFNRHDPSLLRAGAVLNVPSVPDLSSAASGVTPVSAPSAAAAATPAPASTPAASAAAAASNAAAQAVSAASSAAAAASAGASAANVAANTASATTAASAPSTAASAPATTETASSAPATSASAAASSASASDSHVYSGAIQASASTSASAATASNSSAPVHASSLQQLLALKNRVLMALQHGVGKSGQATQANGAPAASGAAAQTAANADAAAAQTEVSPVTWGIVAAVLVGLLALIVGAFTRKRKKSAEAAIAESETKPQEPILAAAVAEPEVEARFADQPPPVAEAAPDVREPVAPVEAVAEVEDRTERRAEEPTETPHLDATLGHATEAASLEAAAALGADALPLTLSEPEHPPAEVAENEREDRATHGEPTLTQEHAHEPHEVHEPETPHDATEAASLAAAAELGAEALPPESMTAHEAAPAKPLDEPEPLAPSDVAAAPDLALDFGDGLGQTPRPASAETSAPLPQAEPEALPQPPVSLMESALAAAPAVPEEDMNYLDVPVEFPRDAVEALGDIGLPLPPRINEPAAPLAPITPFSSEPFATPPAPLVGEAIEAGLAGAGALAGLGAPRFGALTLDFDLDLPPDSAAPLPVFTPEQLTRIARNKLDLAQEYIALGDLSGARSLINEVIESNDHATRSDAQALLSTLAPLS